MRSIALVLGLSLIVNSPLSSASVQFEASASGQFIIISENRDFSPSKAIALHASIITSVRLEASNVIVRTSEIDIHYESKDKEKIRVESSAAYIFRADNEKEARELFNIICAQPGLAS